MILFFILQNRKIYGIIVASFYFLYSYYSCNLLFPFCNAMKQQSNMSFLDVMACGLGSLLFLFFIFTAIKQNLNLDTIEQSQNTSQVITEPLIILLTSPGNEEPCIAKEPWEISHTQYQPQLQQSPFFAVLYSNVSPPDGCEIWAKLAKENIPISVQIFHAGQPKLRYRGDFAKEFPAYYRSQKIRLWPIPKPTIK